MEIPEPLFMDKFYKSTVFNILAILVGLGICVAGGYRWGWQDGQTTPKTINITGVSNAVPQGTANGSDFSVFWQTWDLLGQNYLKYSDVTGEKRVQGAVRGLAGSMGDPYTTYFNPKESKDFQESVQGKGFGGIGIEIGSRKGQLMVIAPLKGTPADKAGLRAGDYILRINATSTENLSVDQVVTLIRGKEGTDVTLLIFRDGWDKTKEFKITRSTIEIPTLDLTMKDDGVAYIQLYSFNGNASRLFGQAALQAGRKGARGVVLDLRNNPGGYLDSAVDIAGWFMPRGKIVVSEAGRSNSRGDLRANGTAALDKLPVVVLINKGSASASEILAGALRDQRGAKLVGEQSFGKGTVQEVFDLKDGSSIKITIAHWVMPSGQILDSEGIKPDFNVPITDSDIEKNKDPQLDKAMSIIKGEIDNN